LDESQIIAWGDGEQS